MLCALNKHTNYLDNSCDYIVTSYQDVQQRNNQVISHIIHTIIFRYPHPTARQ